MGGGGGERLNNEIKRSEWTLFMTVGEPKRITAIITRSIHSNSEKRQHTKTRAGTSVSREPVDVAVSCSIKRHFHLMLIWADFAYSTNTKIGAARSLVQMSGNTSVGWRSGQSEHRHEANSTDIHKVRQKKCQTVSPQSSSFYWATTIMKNITYHNPHCTAYAYSDTQLVRHNAWNTDGRVYSI